MALVGIYNENDFYSNHYLTSVFESDIRGVMDNWQQQETEAREHEKQQRLLGREPEQGFRAPHTQLNSYSGPFFKQLNEHGREKDLSTRLRQQRKRWKSILEPLGYQLKESSIELETGLFLPVLAHYQDTANNPFLWIVEAHDKFDEDNQDPLALALHKQQLPKDVLNDEALLKKQTGLLKTKNQTELSWQDLISKHILTQPEPPRWILLLGNRQALLIDRSKWAQNRLLRFNFEEILGRKETETLKATAALLHKDSVMPESGQPLLDNLDENSHKHAFAVSEDLKYALRESIELLGNETTQYLIKHSKVNYTGQNAIQPEELSRECLRYMYRMLFLFYIEARPELEYAPMKSMTYLKGYSLENLRDLEMIPLYSEEDKKGHYLNDSLNLLFRLIHKGYTARQHIDARDIDDFSITQLDSHLFDPKRTPTLNKVVFSNLTLQRIIQLMSLSKPKRGARARRGRISYSQLGINQLGAVYEALLSYRGFFAHELLYEVKKKGESPNELETGYFVTAEQFQQYDEEEKVTHTVYEAGEKKTRYKKFEKGSFIYRMAGRDREKSASYYTPEVLTHSLVKYALKELYKEKIDVLNSASEKAEAIINLTVCEPAMGSAAFLNEAINQLSEQFLFYKQQAEDKRIPQDEYTQELQRVKMYIADNNVFGVDLNPVAVELAEVSLWLNAISSNAFVPWFGYQLFNGNSLIGARRQVFSAHQLTYKNSKTPSWLNQAPTRIMPNAHREEHQVYHFLLGDNGMANYTDKVVKGLKGKEIEAINKWRKDFNLPWSDEHKSQLQRISKKIDDLWGAHTQQRAQERKLTTDKLPIWPEKIDVLSITNSSNMASKDQMVLKAMTDGSSSYQRLKMVMDYWCALWFWPIDKFDELPDRDAYLFEIETLLDGYIQPELIEEEIVETEEQEDPEPASLASAEQLQIFGDDAVKDEKTTILTAKGTLNKKVIFKHLPRLALVDKLSQQYKYLHWELEFADIFDRNQGFDLILGNPPWLKVQWQEGGILGDANPIFVLRKFSATKMNELRGEILSEYPLLDLNYLTEYVEAEGTQNFLNGTVNYPVLNGIQTNLYKCFLPQAWMISNEKGISGFLHPEGIYDDSKGGAFRQEIYPRLRAHYQFQNEKALFPIGNRNKFSFNIYGGVKSKVCFNNIANLFVTKTIDLCFKHNGSGEIGGIKDDCNNWDVSGHQNRVINVDIDTLGLFAKLYDENGTPVLAARLPAIHSQQLISVLAKFAAQTRRLGDMKDEYLSLEMWHESNSQKDGTIIRNTQFPQSSKQWILSGPHFYVCNPIYQTPRKVCETHKAYDNLDLMQIPDEYLPRTNYVPACDEVEYLKRIPNVPWMESGVSQNRSVTEYYRLGIRKRLSQSGERTIIPCILPPQSTHILSVLGTTFKKNESMMNALWTTSAITFDFFIKSNGQADFTAGSIPYIPILDGQEFFDSAIIRLLTLNSLTINYAEFWRMNYKEKYRTFKWAKIDSRLNNLFFQNLTSDWHRSYALRTDYSRRQALVEVDILAAMALNLTLDELQTIYRVQFPVLRQNEADTWYDQAGRITFTSSKGLVGVGLGRNYKKDSFKTGIKNGVFVTGSEAIHRDGTGSTDKPWTDDNLQLGWEDIKDLQSGIVTKTYMDDTMPGGPTERTIEYHAPFDRCNREDDYNIVWAEFERRFGEDK